MSSLLLLTNALQPSTEVLPALGLLLHNVRVAPAEGPALVDTPGADVILIDGRRDLPQVRSLCQLLRSTGPGCPLILVVTEGGLAAVTADWGIDDVLLDTAGPAEVEARLRLAMGRQQISTDDSPMEIRNGDLSVDEATYSAKLKGRVLDLTFKEFELLKYLAQHPGRVFTRAQLLQEVWGYDYFGGTRTVDVHVRRLRAKLGPEHESLIGTVRNVGYRFVAPEKADRSERAEAPRTAPANEPHDAPHNGSHNGSRNTAHNGQQNGSQNASHSGRSDERPAEPETVRDDEREAVVRPAKR
jgi:DNA-binding response OmpR family regulator